jgi:hypothetical protein
MSDVSIRYWKRAESDGTTVYFATATNAGHAKAEDDERATSISYREYQDNVPQQVHNGADRETASIPNSPIEGKQAAWMALQGWTDTHSNNVAIQDMIAMLELWKFQLCAWANATMAQNQGAQVKPQESNNVN